MADWEGWYGEHDSSPTERLKIAEATIAEFAHALYTCAMHANSPYGHGGTLILDRIRGTATKHPELLKAYPQLREVLSLSDERETR